MSDLFWAGDERAGALMSQPALLDAMVAVEQAWLETLVAAGTAPASAKADLVGLVGPDDIDEIATASEGGGNPVLPLLSLLRKRVGTSEGEAAGWIHKGLTSQDVVDTALVLCVRDVLGRLDAELRLQAASLVALADRHRATVMVGRTLTQHAVPITFGLKAAGWLTGVLDAAEAVTACRDGLVAQVGGAAGTLAATVELARSEGVDDPEVSTVELSASLAGRLGLGTRMPWHTSRTPVTRVGDALVGCTDAWGRIASDVAVGARPEIGELSEPTGPGRGGSSTMPQKQNPVLSVLIRRAAITTPLLGATLHTAAALAVDERPDGAWHAEWATLRDLGRRTVVAASQTSELLGGLYVHSGRMEATLSASAHDVLAEQRSISRGDASGSGGDDARSYLGINVAVIDAALERAATYLGNPT